MQETDFLDWARGRAIPLPASLSPDSRATRWLETVLAGKRLVLLGEPDHFIAEKALYRENFIRTLWHLGVRHIAEELSFSDGYRINTWLHRGDPDAALEVATFGASVGLRSDRTDEASGVLKASFELGPHSGFVRQARALLSMLQPLFGKDPSASFFGFDVDYTPGGGYQDLVDAAPAALKAQPQWYSFTQRLQQVSGETLAEEIDRLNALQQWVRDQTAQNEGWFTVLRHLAALTNGYRYIQQAYPAADYAALAPAMALRESIMHSQLVEHLRSISADERCVVLGHNLHLARRDDLISAASGVNPGGGQEHSLGHYLHQVYPGQILSIWLIQGYGEDSQPLIDLPRRLNPPANSFNRLLGKIGDAFLLPISGAASLPELLRQPQAIYHMYNAHYETAPADQTDAIVFVREVSPA